MEKGTITPARTPQRCWSAWGEPAGRRPPWCQKRPADEGALPRVQVEGTQERRTFHVNVSVPLVLAWLCRHSPPAPPPAAEGMKAQGIDLAS